MRPPADRAQLHTDTYKRTYTDSVDRHTHTGTQTRASRQLLGTANAYLTQLHGFHCPPLATHDLGITVPHNSNTEKEGCSVVTTHVIRHAHIHTEIKEPIKCYGSKAQLHTETYTRTHTDTDSALITSGSTEAETSRELGEGVEVTQS